MSDYKNPVLAGEEHIANHVHDFAKPEGLNGSRQYAVMWDDKHFKAYTLRDLVEQIIDYENISSGI